MVSREGSCAVVSYVVVALLLRLHGLEAVRSVGEVVVDGGLNVDGEIC